MNGEININWKGKQIDYNPHVFYEEFASDDEPLISMGELQEINDYIQETYAECETYVQEGSIIKNIGKGFVYVIKKIISAIVRVLTFIGRQISKLFPKRIKSDIASICRKLKMKKDGRFEMKDDYNTKDPLFKYTTIEGNNMLIDVGHIFKKSPKSSKIPTTIKTVTHNVLFKSNSGLGITIPKDELNVLTGWLSSVGKNISKKEQPTGNGAEASVLLAYVKYPDVLVDLGTVFQPILNALTSGENIDANRCDRYIKQINKFVEDSSNKMMKYINSIQGTEQFIKYEDMRQLQKKVSTVSDLFMKFQDAEFDINNAMTDEHKESLIGQSQSMLGLLERLQMGLNNLIKASNRSDKFISGDYIGSCDNLVLLDSFVKEMIKEGIPSSYIGLNAYLVASPKIRGSFDDKWEPKWGQSRLTLYPSDKSNVCYKIALNGMGTRSNNTEYSWYKSKPELHDILAGVRDIGANKCVLVVERLQENRPVSWSLAMEFRSRNIERLEKYKLEGDIHQNNVAYDMNGNIKIIDFGWVNMP